MRPRTAIRNCRDAVALLTDYLDGGLTADAVERLAAHLALCLACEDFLKTLRSTRDAVRGLAAEAVPEECRRELRALLAPARRTPAGVRSKPTRRKATRRKSARHLSRRRR
jgi:anti-sigma factor RsiW